MITILYKSPSHPIGLSTLPDHGSTTSFVSNCLSQFDDSTKMSMNDDIRDISASGMTVAGGCPRVRPSALPDGRSSWRCGAPGRYPNEHG